MLTHLRRTGAGTFDLSFTMPIDTWSRSAVDTEAERLRDSVIPIIGADVRRRPYLVGSAVVLLYRDRKVLVTAEHVLGDSEKVPLAFFGADGCSRPFGGDFMISMASDLAVKLLPPDEIDALSHVPFISDAAAAAFAGPRAAAKSVIAASAENFMANVIDSSPPDFGDALGF